MWDQRTDVFHVHCDGGTNWCDNEAIIFCTTIAAHFHAQLLRIQYFVTTLALHPDALQ